MKTVWMLSLILSFSVHAVEFKYIKLKPQFQEYLRRSQMKSAPGPSTQGMRMMITAEDSAADPIQDQKVREILVGSSPEPLARFSDTPGTGNQSLLYEEIRRQLEHSHQGIGQLQVNQIKTWNEQFNLGTQNFSGFSWQKPFGTASVHVDRQITPPLLVDRWMILDSFVIRIEASTFLEKLKEAGLLEEGWDIGAFAGINFTRTYYYWHFANSYNEALASDYSKLFMPFTMFNQQNIESMGDNEVITREDNWTASAGGVISSPPLYNLSLKGGVLAQFALKQRVSVQASAADPANVNAQRFSLGITSSQSKSVGSTIGLQLDFFNLLKITLLEADLTYQYTEGKSYALNLSAQQWQHISSDPVEGPEFRNILTGFGEVKALEPYVSRLDENKIEDLKSQGSVLLWGKLKKTKTESIHTIKDNLVRVWFKSYSRSVKYVQSFWSRVFSTVFYALLKFPVGTRDVAIYSKEIVTEYEATHPQSAVEKIQRIESSEQFSFKLIQSYEASSTSRKSDRTYKNDTIWFMDVFTSLSGDLIAAVKNDTLRGPLLVESSVLVEKAGFDYFVNRPVSDIFLQVAKVCGSKKGEDWANDEKRPKLLKIYQYGNEKCVKDIGTSFIGFITDYRANFLKPSLYKFKAFLGPYYKKSENIADLIAIFGVDNTFVTGKIQATTNLGNTFVQHFSNGQFRGLGVIDNYYRSTGTRLPASIGE